MLPPPVACGAPSTFRTWRAGQPEALCAVVDAPTRVSGLVLPTGAGKSLITTTLATLTGWRTVILTSTKALQDQVGEAFPVTDLRGQSNYPCVALQLGGLFQQYRTNAGTGCDLGPCKVGLRCPLRDAGCAYFDALGAARHAPVLVTNYQAWMAQQVYGEGLGTFDCLVCDEAHAAPDEVAQFLASTLSLKDLAEAGLPAPDDVETMDAWIDWADQQYAGLKRQVDRLGEQVKLGAGPSDVQQLRGWRRTLGVVERLHGATAEQWLVTVEGQTFHFHPLDIGAHVESVLFHDIPHVVLTSATLTRKTAETLGLDPTTVTWHEQPSTFPVERRPIVHVQTARIDHRLDHTGTQLWLARVDQILRARRDRKGIIHTGSYARAKLIYGYSEFSNDLILPTSTSTRSAVAVFRAAGPGTVLVSPALTTGFDFPDDACEFQIILKVPWPDSREPVMVARTQQDKSYPAYVAMQALVQAVGRGMRSPSDRCETLILDEHVRWFLQTYRAFAPQWFLDAYRSSRTIPAPPPRL
jgi:Rad3-related DNA helicase